MDLEDFLKVKRRHGHGHHYDDYHDDHRYHGYHHGHYKLELIRSVLRSLPHKKTLLAGLVIVCTVFVILGIMVVCALLPFLSMLMDLVQQKGIQGVLEALNAFIQQLWKGNG